MRRNDSNQTTIPTHNFHSHPMRSLLARQLMRSRPLFRVHESTAQRTEIPSPILGLILVPPCCRKVSRRISAILRGSTTEEGWQAENEGQVRRILILLVKLTRRASCVIGSRTGTTAMEVLVWR